jgi:hypothetical protein
MGHSFVWDGGQAGMGGRSQRTRPGGTGTVLVKFELKSPPILVNNITIILPKGLTGGKILDLVIQG